MPQIVLDTQADWQRGEAVNLDLDSDPGSAQLQRIGVAFDGGGAGRISVPGLLPFIQTEHDMTLEADAVPDTTGRGTNQTGEEIVLAWPGWHQGLVWQEQTKNLEFELVFWTDATKTTQLHRYVAAPLAVGERARFAATYEMATKTMQIFKDGALVQTLVLPAAYVFSPLNSSALYMGATPSGSWGWRGTLYEGRVWNCVRTQAEIQAALSASLTGTEAGLMGLWRFHEAAGTTAFDSTPNGNNGSLTASVARVCPPSGTLTLPLDTGAALAAWQSLALEGLQLPGITYRSRSSFDQVNWSPWAAGLSCPPGRFVQLEITLATADSVQTPVLQRAVLDYLVPALERWNVRVGQPNWRTRVGARNWQRKAGQPSYKAAVGQPNWSRRRGESNWKRKVGKP